MNDTQDVLDLRGRACPLPVLDTYRGLKLLNPGGTLCVLTSDPVSARNFSAFCRQSGHQLVETKAQGQEITLYIRKAKRHH